MLGYSTNLKYLVILASIRLFLSYIQYRAIPDTQPFPLHYMTQQCDATPYMHTLSHLLALPATQPILALPNFYIMVRIPLAPLGRC